MYSSLPERYREEQVFIREILFEPTDLTARLVYADWLDDRQDLRARLLRIDVDLQQLAAGDHQRQSLVHERSQLLPKLDRAWVALLALAPIEKCQVSTDRERLTDGDGSEPETETIQFQYRCPKRWENLRPSDDDDNTRFCNECERNVYYCYDIASARLHSQRGRCVALDPSVPRKPYDLDYLPESDLGVMMGDIRSS